MTKRLLTKDEEIRSFSSGYRDFKDRAELIQQIRSLEARLENANMRIDIAKRRAARFEERYDELKQKSYTIRKGSLLDRMGI